MRNVLKKIWFQGARDCRTLHCPTGQRRIKGGKCTHLVTKWSNFRAVLNLEIKIPDLGLNQLEKTLALARRMSTKTHAKPYWLDWTVKGRFACYKENHRETFVNVVVERHMKTWSPNAFLTYIKQMLTRPIHTMIANTEYKLSQYLHTHVYDHKWDANVSMCANPASETFEFYAPKVPKTANSEVIDTSSCIYCQSIPDNVTQDSTFFITDLYYCDQVVFNETEFEYIGKSVYIHPINKVFHDLDYMVVARDSQSFVNVCADKASYVPVGNLGLRMQLNVLHYLVLVPTVIFTQHFLI